MKARYPSILRWLRLAAAVLGLAAASASAQTELFWAGNGSPTSQGWIQLVQGTPGVVTSGGGEFRLDTMADVNTQHGFMRFSPVALDTNVGFQMTFSLRLDGDNSPSPNRGGFSLVVVGQDPTQSLELVFENGEVYSYDYVAGDPDRFVRGAGFTYAAGTPLNLVFTVAQNTWTLNHQGQIVLSGAMVDYTAQGSPYVLPNFLFFGDNTSRAASNVVVDSLVLTAVPEPSAAALWLAGAGVLMLRWRRTRRLSNR